MGCVGVCVLSRYVISVLSDVPTGTVFTATIVGSVSSVQGVVIGIMSPFVSKRFMWQCMPW